MPYLQWLALVNHQVFQYHFLISKSRDDALYLYAIEIIRVWNINDYFRPKSAA